MLTFTSLPGRILCRSLAVILANAIVPFGIPKLVADSLPKNFTPKVEKKSPPKSHLLTGKEMKKLQGKAGENPYLAGQNKWDPTFKGVDLLTGNFSTSTTDLDFEQTYGIPVNVTRSYSANNGDEGPFGKGWTLSADMRTTAGGILKSPSVPIKSVPNNIAEQPPKEYNPNAVSPTGQQGQTGSGSAGAQAATTPVQAVVTTDAVGTAETVQKDVDGILTTPPWDDNVHNATYQFVNFQGNVYQVTLGDQMTTIDGTTYTYAAEGYYPNGQLPFNAAQMSPSPNPTPANVLKVTTATDRQGNVTAYTYGGSTGSSQVTFQKQDGVTVETPLTGVKMPNGHTITFTWSNLGSTQNPIWRITSAYDNNAARTVNYGYTGRDLTSVTSPGGRMTQYTYGGAGATSDWTNSYNLPVASDLLTGVTTPQGLMTHIYYQMSFVNVLPYNATVAGVAAYRVDDPNGVRTYFALWANGAYNLPSGDNPFWSNAVLRNGACDFVQIKDWGLYPSGTNAYSGTGVLINSGSLTASVVDAGSDSTMTVTMYDGVAPTALPSGYMGQRYAKSYNIPNETLINDDETNYGEAIDSSIGTPGIFANPHNLPAAGWFSQDVITAKQYNFMGNPLSATTTETQTVLSGTHGQTPTTTINRTTVVQHAYWGASKFYQQRAILDQAGRYMYTDYYPNSALAGSRGQTYETYTSAFATFSNTASSDPSGWQYDIIPTSGSAYSSKFIYDAIGRATDIYKLQAVSSGTPIYVHTSSTYTGSANSWGQANQVTEDVGGINRVTTTNAWTPYGKPCDVTDAAGHEFHTYYDLDNLFQSVVRTDVSPNQTLVTYYNGTSGLNNGVPWKIIDGLSGVTQIISYDNGSADGGVGQVSSVQESNGTDVYTTAYTYDDAGNRAALKYTTPQMGGDSIIWGYGDYIQASTPDSPKFAFQTLTRLDPANSNAPTYEAMHYLYDSGGRLEDAAFAQTPTATGIQSDTGSWYDLSHPAASRARAYYTYDPGGRLQEIDHCWDIYANNTYSSQYLIGNGCAYEVNTGENRGLKLADYFYNGTTSSPAWTQTYGYDSNLDYLISANYGDGQANASQTWAYDAAGNRTSDYTGSGWTYDNLNRVTASPNTTYTNDILGNRTATTKTIQSGGGVTGTQSGSMTWDCLNRMVSATAPGALAHTNYEYRADGMRVQKSYYSGATASGTLGGPATSSGLATSSSITSTAAAGAPVATTSSPTQTTGVGDVLTMYRYDGQMPMETYAAHDDGSSVLTDHGLGARGAEYVQVQSLSTSGQLTTTIEYPIYDAHGNEVATLSRNGSSGYALSNQRSYGAWGEVRQGAATGGPRGRYSGNLGHVQDDETGLIYMRARYYESSSGRFVNQDPGHNGFNWFVYAGNIPTTQVDFDGQDAFDNVYCAFVCGLVSAIGAWGSHAYSGKPINYLQAVEVFLVAFAQALAIAAINPEAEAAEAGAAISKGALMKGIGLGAFSNLAAGLFIDLICGDTPGADLLLDAACGGFAGGASMGIDGAGPNSALGAFLGAANTFGNELIGG